MTLFCDRDGKAYLIHSSDWNKTLRISRLTEDYLDVDGVYGKAFVEQEREAPALFEKDGVYYMITSGCTGWDPNNALFATSPTVLSGWKLIDNPCVGEHARQTFFGQSTYIFEKDGVHYLMLDHWKPENLKGSGYSILPIQIEDGHLTIAFQTTQTSPQNSHSLYIRSGCPLGSHSEFYCIIDIDDHDDSHEKDKKPVHTFLADPLVDPAPDGPSQDASHDHEDQVGQLHVRDRPGHTGLHKAGDLGEQDDVEGDRAASFVDMEKK